MDSATTLAVARAEGYECHALSFRYGQRHALELEAARGVARSLGARSHKIVDLDLRSFGGSALTADIDVPKGRPVATLAEEIPVTYVPARNTIFLSFALGWAEVLEARAIFLGANAVDYSGYPDCRPEFLQAFQEVARLGTKAGIMGRAVRIEAPLIDLSKAEIVRRGMELGVDFGLTLTCYDPGGSGEACGRCDACQLRLNGFAAAGLSDPARYQADARS